MILTENQIFENISTFDFKQEKLSKMKHILIHTGQRKWTKLLKPMGKWSNIHIIGVYNRGRKMFKEIVAKIFPDLMIY